MKQLYRRNIILILGLVPKIVYIVPHLTALGLAEQHARLSKAANPHSEFCHLLNNPMSIKPFHSSHFQKRICYFSSENKLANLCRII